MEPSAIVQEILSGVSLLAAIVAIISTIFSTVITAGINKYWEHRTKKLELFFHEKVDAYSAFFCAVDRFSPSYTSEGISDLASAAAKVLLFAPENIRLKLTEYTEAVCVSAIRHRDDSVSKEAFSAAAKAAQLRGEVLRLLHDDLVSGKIR